MVSRAARTAGHGDAPQPEDGLASSLEAVEDTADPIQRLDELKAAFRVRSSWWLFILRWVDAADILYGDDGSVYLHPRTYYLIYDLIVSRPAEAYVLASLLRNALNLYHDERRMLTDRQERALDLADEAARNGENGARYVAVKMNVGVSAAYKLLQRAYKTLDRPKMSNLGPLDVSTGNAHSQRDRIRQIEAGYSQNCPGKGANRECDGTIKGARDLCWHCYQRYGLDGERPPWLVFLIDEARKARYEWARDAVLLAAYDDETVAG